MISHSHDEGVTSRELAGSIDGAAIAPLVVRVEQTPNPHPVAVVTQVFGQHPPSVAHHQPNLPEPCLGEGLQSVVQQGMS